MAFSNNVSYVESSSFLNTANTWITDAGTWVKVAEDMLPVITIIAGFFPGASVFFSILELAIKDSQTVYTTLSNPGFMTVAQMVINLFTDNDPNSVAYTKAAQAAFEDGLPLDSDAAIAKYPDLGKRTTIFQNLFNAMANTNVISV